MSRMVKRMIRTRMRHGLREVHVDLGLFDYAILVVIGQPQYLSKYLQWKYEDRTIEIGDEIFRVNGYCSHKKGYVPVIWIPCFPKTARHYATLAHEAVHAISDFLEWVHMYHERATEEVMAHGVSCVIKRVAESNKKENKR